MARYNNEYEGYIVKINGRSGEYEIDISASQSLADLKKRCQNPITFTAQTYRFGSAFTTMTIVNRSPT